MAKNSPSSIVVCVDGSAPAEEAFEQALDLCLKLGRPMQVVTVVPSANIYYLTGPPPAVPDEEQVRYHWELAARYVERAKARGVKEAGFVVLDGNPVDAILDHLEREPIELLVVGARGLSRTQRLLLGSVSSALVQQAKCSILVAKVKVRGVSAATDLDRSPQKTRRVEAAPFA
ncbi:MAG: universal stress protein [Euryarchaeota archaeon]|nr:universal stress protein [Euryarchaeota archaeon]MDE1835364.1 universal stress protein [Euryarchaeota archaeon]MDE1880467.1 universal stress protein [Euryarchaeota archaeon]MDE2043660.1 universal stress protein [Thermoplasmata archaeon]